MKHKVDVKLLTTILGCTMFIIVLSNLCTYGYQTVFGKKSMNSSETHIVNDKIESNTISEEGTTENSPDQIDTTLTPTTIANVAVPLHAYVDAVQSWAKELQPITIKKGTEFSLLRYVNDDLLADDEQIGLNIIASGIYKAILQSNFEVRERHLSPTLPNYITLGYEALVQPNKLDFVFYNGNASDYTISLVIKDEALIVSLIGLPFDTSYEVVATGKETFNPKTIIQYSSLIKQGNYVLKEKGKQGFLIIVQKNKRSKENVLLETIPVSEDFYPPVPRVEIHSLLGRGGQSNDLEEIKGTDFEKNENASKNEVEFFTPPAIEK